jgi:hypothetical protein
MSEDQIKDINTKLEQEYNELFNKSIIECNQEKERAKLKYGLVERRSTFLYDRSY